MGSGGGIAGGQSAFCVCLLGGGHWTLFCRVVICMHSYNLLPPVAHGRPLVGVRAQATYCYVVFFSNGIIPGPDATQFDAATWVEVSDVAVQIRCGTRRLLTQNQTDEKIKCRRLSFTCFPLCSPPRSPPPPHPPPPPPPPLYTSSTSSSSSSTHHQPRSCSVQWVTPL